MKIIRPAGISRTPRTLARQLNTTTRKSTSDLYTPDWHADFFLTYPAHTRRQDSDYLECRHFDAVNKYGQRRYFHDASIPIPNTVNISEVNPNNLFVARPYRHHSGNGYRLIEFSQIRHDPLGYGCYYSELFPKKWEYRLIFVKGVPALTLLKRVPETLDNSQPWNHANGASFITVYNHENNRLRHTDAEPRLAALRLTQAADIIAYDILLARDYNWVVSEANFCPALTIPANIARVTQIIERTQNAN